MIRGLFLIVVACLLAGCDGLTAGFTSAQTRITQAFPLPDEIVLARMRLQQAVGRDTEAGRLDNKAFDNMVRVRALTCTTSVSIGRFDTPADIKRKVSDPECFRQQDAQLADWIGLRRIGQLLEQPPLRPMTALAAPTLLPALKDGVAGVTAAEAANVLVFRGSRHGQFTAIDLPQGNVIQSFEITNAGYTQFNLSPNGRVFAVPLQSRGVQFIDVESGATLWTSQKYVQVTAWLPKICAMVMVSTGSEPTVIIDARQGRAIPYPLAEKSPTWAATVPGAANRLLIGGQNTATLMEHARNADGMIDIQPLNQWQLAKPVTSTTPMPMLMNNGGKLVYVTMRDLAWFDFATGNQGVWEISAFNGNSYAKLDERTIFLRIASPGSRISLTGRVLDIEQQTLASVPGYVHDEWLTVLPLTPRTGYLRWSSSSRSGVMSVGAEVPTDVAEDIQSVIAKTQAEQQQAKLKDLPQPMLPNVPDNAQVAIVGVYEGKSPGVRAGPPPSHRPPGDVRINVRPSSTPLILVLSSYEPVHWHVQNAGRKISAVLLSSYGESNVFGVDSASVLKIGSTYAYTMNSSNYARLKGDIARYVSNPVRSFQGAYSGQDFSIPSFN